MTKTVLNLDISDALGRTIRVDTGSVWAEASDHDKLTHVGVGSLIAFQGANGSEYLIGMLERVTRDLQEEADLNSIDDEGNFSLTTLPRDLLRVVLLGTYRQVEGTRENTFKRGADSYPQIDSYCWIIEGSNLQGFMSLFAQQLAEEKRLVLGHFVADATAIAIADGDRLFQRHAALLGSTGSGKSWSVALILERARALPHANLLVFDMHGEYTPLTEGGENAIAKGFKIAGPKDMELSREGILFLPWWLLNQDEMQALLLDRSEENAPNQAARLSYHVRELKKERLTAEGHNDILDYFTVDSPVPYSLSELITRLRNDDTQMVEGAKAGTEKQGPFHGRLSRFLMRATNRIEDRRYAFMFNPSDSASRYEWLHKLAKDLLGTNPGIKIIDFSEVPSEVLPIVVGVLARVLYQIHFWTEDAKRTPITFVCDEAHLYLPARDGNVGAERALDSFEKIAKEGRKYGISLFVVSQRPSDVSRTVLSQCNNFIILRLTNDQDQQVVRRLMPDNMESLTASLPLLDVGEALILGDAIILPTRIKLDAPKVKPTSATMNFWSVWNETEVDDEALIAAVEAMRRQSRQS
jgi:hypothetical protein